MLRPRHLRNVDQAFHALLQFHKSPIIGNAHHPALYPAANGIFLFDVLPRVRRELFHAQRNPLPFLIIIEYLHLNLVANGQDLRGVSNASPGNIGDVEQAIQPAKVDKRAKVGDVLDHPFPHLAHLQGFQDLLAKALPLLFQHHTPGNDDIASILVKLDNAERKDLADKLVEVLHLLDVDLRTWQKGIDAKKIHHNSALDATHQAPFDNLVVVVRQLDPIPDPHKVGLGLGKDDLPFLVFHVLQVDFNLLPDLYFRGIPELRDRNNAL